MFFSAFEKRLTKMGISALLGLTLGAGAASAQTTLFADEFNASSWDTSKWTTYGPTNFLQRTQFGNQPTMATESGTSFARLRLDSYTPDPAYKGEYLRGTEVLTKTQFTPGDGIELETRMRGNDLPRGIVFAFFTYGERGTWPNELRDEIDYEFLTNFDKDKIWLNIWDDYNKQSGIGDNQSSITQAPGLDRTGWHTYKIRWTKSRIDWYVDGVSVRTSTDILPADPMALRFNIWAGATSWPTAYDENLPVTSDPSANQSFYVDVDWVRVRTLPGATVGNGTGLTGTYYNNMDFTGSTIKRVDPTVNFEWGQGSPDPAIGEDTFTVRWTGQVQAQYDETYTFITNTDDGVRLWVNGKLLVDQWQNGSAAEQTGDIALKAGQKYDIKMEYYEDGGGAVAQLKWSSQQTPKQIIPKSQLYPAAVAANTPPTVTITAPANNGTYTNTPGFTGSARDAETSILAANGLLLDQSRKLYWNGSAWKTTAVTFPITLTSTGNWNYTLPSLQYGRYTLRATAMDSTRLTTSTTISFFVNNNKAPTVAITSLRNGQSFKTQPTFVGTASDADGSVRLVQGLILDQTRKLYWNGSVWVSQSASFNLTGTTSWSYNLPNLREGSYTFRATAFDNVNAFAVALATIYVDSTAPVTSITSPQNNSSASRVTTVQGTATDAASGILWVRLRLWNASTKKGWNGSNWVNVAALASAPLLVVNGTTSWNYTLPTLTPSAYVVQSVASDRSSNTANSAAVNFTITAAGAQAKVAASTEFSSGEAAGGTITLNFTGALDKSATDPATWSVLVNGQVALVEGVIVKGDTVTLQVADVQSGDEISVSWLSLRDAQGHTIDGDWEGTVQ